MNSIIKWMTEHPVAANLTMIFVIAAGLFTATALPQKTFPEFTLDAVNVAVTYSGASPSEIEESIIKPIEDQLSGIDGIDEMTATASEGRGSVSLSLKLGEDVSEKLDEIKTEVDRITSFPEDAEEPTVTQASNQTRVLEILIHGPASERVLKEEGERLKDELTALPSLSFVQVSNTRDYEISIELDRNTLTAYGLTMAQVAQVVAQNSLELPGGSIDTDTLTIPLRTLGRNYDRSDFESIILLTTPQGATVRLGDVATVIDGFEDTDLEVRFNGEPASTVNVYRVGDEQVLDIVEEVRAHLDEAFRPSLPEGMDVTLWQNDAEELQNRLDLLIKNAVLGLGLVVLCLALFLDIRLAFWAAWGIGIAFLGSFMVMNILDMSINQISLFGFILAIGIVVDNAIVVGENVYTNGERGLSPMQAAVKGTQRIATPVIFSALTTIVAFTPLLQLPGILGKFLGDIPTVVITVLSLSLIQSLIILPRNLAFLNVDRNRPRNILVRILDLIRWPLDQGLRWFINRPLDAILRFCTRRVLVPLALVAALMMVTVGLMQFGYVKFTFFPSIEGKIVTAELEMVDGTTAARTAAVSDRVLKAALRAEERVAEQFDEAGDVAEGVLVVNGQAAAVSGPEGGSAAEGSTLANVVVRLMDPETRDWPTGAFETAWREEIGEITGLKKLTISASLVDAGDAIALEVSLPDGEDITPVIEDLRSRIATIPGVFDLQDDLSSGRLEYELVLKDEARVYGLSRQDLAQQMRNGFFGLEATRVQRGGDDVKVFVRLPANQRGTVSDLLATQIRTPAGALIPLGIVAEIREGRAPTQILRRDGRTITTITADTNIAVTTGGEANAFISAEVIPEIVDRYPGVNIEFGGEQRTQGDAGTALAAAGAGALFVIYALLALIFRSYWKPIVVMSAIPLGLIGAIAGHLIMGLPLSLLSIFGIIGLSGVVINNSLVMIDLYNEYLADGRDVREAVIAGTKDRFRPIVLTSLTTFLGTFPLITETSLQAQFLVPLAVSIGFGVLFGTVIIILAVPALFIAITSLIEGVGRIGRVVSPKRRPSVKGTAIEAGIQ